MRHNRPSRYLIARRRKRRARRQRRGTPGWVTRPLLLATLGLFLSTALAAVAFGVYRSYADELNSPERDLLSQRVIGTAQLFDREGRLLFEFIDPLSGLRDPVSLDDISPDLISATVSTEDASFFDNRGVNERGVVRAAIENLGLGQPGFLEGSGGSSITQQLVKNVLIEPEQRFQRSVDRKLRETILAIELTRRFQKEQILEWYLNSIFYGNLAYGIGAASQRYFDKPPADLTLAEAALLAAIPQSPARYDPFLRPARAKDRQALVLDLMVEHGFITQRQANDAKREPLRFGSRRFPIAAPHFVFYVGDELEALCQRGRIDLPREVTDCADLLTRGGLRVTTSLDSVLQSQAEAVVRDDLPTFEEQTGARNASLVSIDPHTGQILAMVGSRDFFRADIDGQVNLATALNSPGSAFKPITYAAAFVVDPVRWNPATTVPNTPIQLLQPDGSYFSPENFDGSTSGPVSIRRALATSLNIPAFRTANSIGIVDLLDVAHRLGITTMRDPAAFGPSITLGGGDVTLLDLTYTYSVFAGNGLMRGQPSVLDLPPGFRQLDPVAVLEIRDARGHLIYQHDRTELQAIPAPQAFQITHILSDEHERRFALGAGNTLEIDRPAAAKTGTAGDPARNDVRRDFWTVGYTPDFVTGVWVGNADNSPMTGGFSSSTAGLIWHDFMIAAHAGLPPRDFVVPAGVAIADRTHFGGIDYSCGARQFEVFVEGGVPPHPLHLCRPLEIDVRTLLLATSTTPPQFAQLSYESPLRNPPSPPDSGQATLGLQSAQGLLPALRPRPKTQTTNTPGPAAKRREAGGGATAQRSNNESAERKPRRSDAKRDAERDAEQQRKRGAES